MPRSRIEGLLTSFPKLIPANTQHTSVETADVRYVYQPLEELYILLITNKASNILMDIDTLHLVTRVVSDVVRSADEREILRNSFEILGAFDEVISLGYREQVNLVQVRNVLEMESHEEKIQEIISRVLQRSCIANARVRETDILPLIQNKEAEAKEELKRRAKQLELQRREQARMAQNAGRSNTSGGFGGIGAGVTGYASVPRYDAGIPDSPKPSYTSPSTSSSAAPKAPAFKGSGMKLGSKKGRNADLLEALGSEAESAPLMNAAAAPQHEEPVVPAAPELPQVEIPSVAHES